MSSNRNVNIEAKRRGPEGGQGDAEPLQNPSIPIGTRVTYTCGSCGQKVTRGLELAPVVCRRCMVRMTWTAWAPFTN